MNLALSLAVVLFCSSQKSFQVAGEVHRVGVAVLVGDDLNAAADAGGGLGHRQRDDRISGVIENECVANESQGEIELPSADRDRFCVSRRRQDRERRNKYDIHLRKHSLEQGAHLLALPERAAVAVTGKGARQLQKVTRGGRVAGDVVGKRGEMKIGRISAKDRKMSLGGDTRIGE
jgi:hypothetical protein